MKNLLIALIFIILSQTVVSATSTDTPDNDTLLLQGRVTNIHNQSLDSVKIIVTGTSLTEGFVIRDGEFKLLIPVSLADHEITLDFSKNGFRDHSITHTIPTDYRLKDLHVRLYPGYRILLKGRTRVGNMPLEDVNVTIKHGDKVYNQKTLGCFYDEEEYWNCLYLGMFKADITTQDPGDSIKLFFSKAGYEPVLKAMKFSEYSGDQIDVKLSYADRVPEFPQHNLNLKLSPPLKPLHIGSDYNGWFLGLSYYYHLSSATFWRRVAVGLEVSMTTSEYTDEFILLPGEETARKDSFYIDAFGGPSVKFWFIEPEKRKFGSYVGNTLAWSFINGSLVNQPFIGTRYFLDLSKSISLEVRYLSHQIEVTEYQGNMTGAAIQETKQALDEKIMINLGIQVIF
jgi:hypothetical protein